MVFCQGLLWAVARMARQGGQMGYWSLVSLSLTLPTLHPMLTLCWPFCLPAMPILSQFYLKESFVGDKDCPLGWRWERALSGMGATESDTAPFAPAVQVFGTGQMMFKGTFRGLSDSLASPDLFPSSCEHSGHAHTTSFDLREWRSCQYSISQTAPRHLPYWASFSLGSVCLCRTFWSLDLYPNAWF